MVLLGELERLVKAGKVRSDSHPVLVIGAGLSAADSILYTQVTIHFCVPKGLVVCTVSWKFAKKFAKKFAIL